MSSGAALAASVPRHDPLNITLVGDEVNPHGLTDAELTQPEDIASALRATDSGLAIASLLDADSDSVDATCGRDEITHWRGRRRRYEAGRMRWPAALCGEGTRG